MTDKRIKNDQWEVRHLYTMIMNGEINKPKVQRKKRWLPLPKAKNPHAANEKNYIIFLFSTLNSVHAITFGQIDGKFSNIDGNNRINAIMHFLIEPFSLFPENLKDIYFFIDNNIKEIDANHKIKNIIGKFSYNSLMTFHYVKYFETIDEKPFYNEYLKDKRDIFESYFDDLQKKLQINGEDRFDKSVRINVNLFEGYTSDELNITFVDINKYDNKMSEIDLLGCFLSRIDNFDIEDAVIKTEIIMSIKQFYIEKNEGEILNGYFFDENKDKMNGYDFMMGFQNYAHNKCPLLIDKPDNDGLSLFFKLYKTMYKGSFENTLTHTNINEFISKIKQALYLLIKIIDSMRMETLTSCSKSFDSCNKKLFSLSKNNVYLVIITIIGFFNQSVDEKVIVKSIEKSLLFHFFVSEISNKEKKDELHIIDDIFYQAGGSFIDNQADKFYKSPHLFSERIKEKHMIDVINTLIQENIKDKIYETRDNGKDKNDKRRTRKFHEKALWYYYYTNKVPIEYLKHTYWIEHIFPFSSYWEDTIDIDRMGNIFPIIDTLNNKRNNKHISEYKKQEEGKYIQFVNDIIPKYEDYDAIIDHTEKKPHVVDAAKYNDFCSRNEKVLTTNFVKYLFG